jgi:hypothetical protein
MYYYVCASICVPAALNQTIGCNGQKKLGFTSQLISNSRFPANPDLFAFPVSRGKRPGIPGNQIWLFLLHKHIQFSCFFQKCMSFV